LDEETEPPVKDANVPPLISAPTPVKNTTPPPIQSPPVPASNQSAALTRYFEYVGGSSRKFWEISVSGKSFTVRFGRIGTAGQSQSKTLSDESACRREADHLAIEKIKKGYIEGKSN
jgi:predicted DNA-binding WGR domain protein